MNFYKLIFSFLTILFIFSCEKKCTKNYHFEFSITMYPEKDTFLIGDTIFLEIKFDPSDLTNLENNEVVNSNDFDFELRSLISKYDSSSVIDAIDNFEYGATVGTVSRVNLVTLSKLTFQLESITNNKIISYYIIPQSVGYYYFTFSAESALYKEPTEFIDSKCEEYLTVDLNLNENVDNNFQHYKDNSIDINATLETAKTNGFYAFVVID